MSLTVHRIPKISTAHLTRQVRDTLTAMGSNNPWCVCAPWEHGFFMFLEELTAPDTPKCLEDICNWLKAHGYSDCWVRLDADADLIPDLPDYGMTEADEAYVLPSLSHLDPWEDDPEYPAEDWKQEVVNGETRRSYLEWVESEKEVARHEAQAAARG